jgi:Glycosyl hydrolase family 76
VSEPLNTYPFIHSRVDEQVPDAHTSYQPPEAESRRVGHTPAAFLVAYQGNDVLSAPAVDEHSRDAVGRDDALVEELLSGYTAFHPSYTRSLLSSQIINQNKRGTELRSLGRQRGSRTGRIAQGATAIFLAGVATFSVLEKASPNFAERTDLISSLTKADMRQAMVDGTEYASALEFVTLPPVMNQPPTNFDILTSEFGLDNGLLRAENSPTSVYASAWACYQYFVTARLAQLLPGGDRAVKELNQRLSKFLQYYTISLPDGLPNAIAQGPAVLHDYTDAPMDDDALWIALSLNLDDPNQLRVAQDIFSLVESQSNFNRGIGAWWRVHVLAGVNSPTKAMVSNAPAVVLGVELFKKTGNPFYLDQAKEIYNWIQKKLRNPANGFYFDHINMHKNMRNHSHWRFQKDKHMYTYVSAMVAAATAALNSVEPHEYPLSDAVDLMRRAIYYANKHKEWELQELDSIFFRVGMKIARTYNNTAFTNLMRNALDRANAAASTDSNRLIKVAPRLSLQILQKLPESEWGMLGLGLWHQN